MPARVDQLIASAAVHDAITNQALGWQRVLRREGIEGHIYAESIGPRLDGRILPLRRFSPGPRGSALLHYSIGGDVTSTAAVLSAEHLGVIYHNVTPAHFLESTNPIIAAACDRGRRGLGQFVGRARVVLADSTFNADELHAVGYDNVRVVPLLLPLPTPSPARLDAVEPIAITVGRIVPNKRIEDAILALAVLQRHSRPDARLIVVGSATGFELYLEALRRLAHGVGVDDAVTFTGAVSDSQRDELYARAGAYVCMSEHEGFCAPLIEALAHSVPVIARSAAAIPETLGGAGMLVPNGDATVVAECLDEVFSNAALRAELDRRGRQRLSELHPTVVETQFLDAMSPLLANA